MEQATPIFVVGFVFGTIAFIAYVVLEVFRSRFRTRAATELQGKLIDRLGSADMAAFLASENSSRMLQALTDRPVEEAAHVRILRALQSGLVMSALGLGLFLYSGSDSLQVDVRDGVRLFATLALSLGIGLLLAAGAAYRLSSRLGLLVRDTPQ